VLRASQPDKQSEELNEFCVEVWRLRQRLGLRSMMLDRRSKRHHVFYQREGASCHNQFDWLIDRLIDWLILSRDSR
jgi:hypothetical protein